MIRPKTAFPPGRRTGSELSLYSDRTGSGDIYVMNAMDGSNVGPLVANPGFDWSPALFPDGRTLAFASARDHTGTYATEIYLLDLWSRELTRLTYNDSYDATTVRSDDGRRIYFTSDRRWGIDDIWVMDVGEGDVVNLTEDDRNDVFGGP